MMNSLKYKYIITFAFYEINNIKNNFYLVGSVRVR